MRSTSAAAARSANYRGRFPDRTRRCANSRAPPMPAPWRQTDESPLPLNGRAGTPPLHTLGKIRTSVEGRRAERPTCPAAPAAAGRRHSFADRRREKPALKCKLKGSPDHTARASGFLKLLRALPRVQRLCDGDARAGADAVRPRRLHGEEVLRGADAAGRLDFTAAAHRLL